MRSLLFLIAMSCFACPVFSQYVYTIKADTVKITNCDSAELVLQNHTQGVPGFLFNAGNGRTVFQRGATQLGNGMYLVGADTIKTSSNAWLQGGNSFGATGVLGTMDNTHLDLYTNDTGRVRLTNTGNLLLGTTTDGGQTLQVNGNSYFNGGPLINLQGNTIDFLSPFPLFSPFIRFTNGSTNHQFLVGSGAGVYTDVLGIGFSTSNPAVQPFVTFGPNLTTFGVNSGGNYSVYFSGPPYTSYNLTSPGSLTVGGTYNNTGFGPKLDFAVGDQFLSSPVIGGGIFMDKTNLGGSSASNLSTRMSFHLRQDSVDVAEIMSLRSDGDVLIGTTTDNGSMLQVNGSSYFNGTMSETGTVNAPTGGNPANGLQVTPTLNATATSSVLNGVLISPIFNSNGYGGVTSYGLNVLNGDSKFADNIYLNSYGDTSRIFSPNTIMYQSNADTGIQHIFADYIITPGAFTGTVVQIEGTSAAVSASMLNILGRNNVAVLNAAANGNVLLGGNLGIGTNSPTTQLHTTGSVRFAGLTQDSTQTNVLVSDASGNLYYRTASSLAAADIIRSSLAVNGPISAQRLTLSRRDWADYVFDSSYRLPSLAATEDYIRRQHHLPGIPSAAEVKEKGVDVGDNQEALLKKIEELTLYAVDQDKRLNEQRETTSQQAKEIDIQNAKIEALEAKIEALTKVINTKIK
jgi:hypothetical protein